MNLMPEFLIQSGYYNVASSFTALISSLILFFRDQIVCFNFKPKPPSKRTSYYNNVTPYDNEGYQETLDELESERGKRKEAEISSNTFESELKQERLKHFTTMIKYQDIQKELAELKNERNPRQANKRDSWYNRVDSLQQYLQQRIFLLSIYKLQFNNALQRKKGTSAFAFSGSFVYSDFLIYQFCMYTYHY